MMHLKVVNQDGTCTTNSISITYSANQNDNSLGWESCGTNIDYIIHSMTQIEGVAFTDTWDTQYLTPNGKLDFKILLNVAMDR